MTIQSQHEDNVGQYLKSLASSTLKTLTKLDARSTLYYHQPIAIMSGSSISSRTDSMSTTTTIFEKPVLVSGKKSSISRVVDKVKGIMEPSEWLPKGAVDFEKMAAKEAERQQRKDDYQGLDMRSRTILGSPGASFRFA